MPAFHPAVSSTLPLAGDGCLHMGASVGHRLGFRRAAPSHVDRGDCEDFQSHPKRNFLLFKVAQKQPGLLQRVCEQIQSVTSSPMRFFLSSEAWAVGFPG